MRNAEDNSVLSPLSMRRLFSSLLTLLGKFRRTIRAGRTRGFYGDLWWFYVVLAMVFNRPMRCRLPADSNDSSL